MVSKWLISTFTFWSWKLPFPSSIIFFSFQKWLFPSNSRISYFSNCLFLQSPPNPRFFETFVSPPMVYISFFDNLLPLSLTTFFTQDWANISLTLIFSDFSSLDRSHFIWPPYLFQWSFITGTPHAKTKPLLSWFLYQQYGNFFLYRILSIPIVPLHELSSALL